MSNHFERQFACTTCGAPFIVYPPDEDRNQASLDEYPTSFPITYICKGCDNANVLHWYQSDSNP